MVKQRHRRILKWGPPPHIDRQRTPIQTTTELSAPAMACVHGGALPPIEPLEIPKVTWKYLGGITSPDRAIAMGYEVEDLLRS